MAMRVRYTVINGEIVSENRGGVVRTYVPDPLGSTIALLDNNQSKTDTFEYWPYGEERARIGTTPTPFRFGGTAGYYRDSAGRTYVRARTLATDRGRWLTADPIGPPSSVLRPYLYGAAAPVAAIDPTGLIPARPITCKERRDAYCRAVNAGGGHGLACICLAAGVACRIIRDPGAKDNLRRWFECMNACMFEHWRRKDTRAWRGADQDCRVCGPDSHACCVAQIAADQDAYSGCEKHCGFGPIPEFVRATLAVVGCCANDQPPGSGRRGIRY